MFTRRKFMAAALVAPALPMASAMAQGVKENEQAKQADFLFVQTSKQHELRQGNEQINPGRGQLDDAFLFRPPGAHRW